MGANPHANGGLLLRDLHLPDFRDYAVHGADAGHGDRRGDHAVHGRHAARCDEAQLEPQNFRVFGPDETSSNRLEALFEVTNRSRSTAVLPRRRSRRADGRVMEVLSEHQCQGWLEGYLLTGRHGFFSCYEAFIHIVDSMFNQHAKWLKVDAPTSRGGGRSHRSTTC